MEKYYIIAAITFFILFINRNKGEKGKLRRIVISLLPLFIFGAVRLNFGADYSAYEDFFNGVHSQQNIYDVNDHMEGGFAWLNKALPSFRLLLTLSSFMMCCSLGYLLYSIVPQKYHALFMVMVLLNTQSCIFFMLSAIRNGFTVAIFVLSYYFMEKKQWKPLALCAFIGLNIHTSIAIIYILSLLMMFLPKFTKISAIIWLSVISFLGFTSLSGLISQVDILVSLFFDRYEDFVKEAMEIADNRGLISALYAICSSAIYLYYLYTTKKDQKPELYHYLALLSIFSMSIGILGGRMQFYFLPFMITGACKMLQEWKSQLRFVYVGMTLFLFYMAFSKWISGEYFTYNEIHTCLE